MEESLHALGLRLGRSSTTEVWATCPAHLSRVGHEDTRPTNFSVNRETGMAYCFGCGYRGDIADVVAQVLQTTRWDARRWLRDHGASVLDYVERVRKPRTVETAVELATDPDIEFVLHDDVPDEMLEERDLDRASVDHYSVKWDDGWWILPFMDPEGRVLGWQQKKGPRTSNYPIGMRKSLHLFGEAQFPKHGRALVVESPLDVVRLHTAGYEGGLATYGARLSSAQMSRILSLSSEIYLLFDDDPVGWDVTYGIMQRYRGRANLFVPDWATMRDLPVWRSEHGKDPGDLTDEGIDALLSGCISARGFEALMYGGE